MNPKDRLQYALYLQRLQDLFVIKENIAFEYQHANQNRAEAQIDKAVDKMLQDNVVNIVDGTTSLEKPNLDHVITEALSRQQKMLMKNPDRYVQNAVEQNTKHFTNILQSRIEKENYSLQRKIEEEYRKKKYNDMSEAEAKRLITEKFQDHGRKRAKNIVKDALHTNQSHMSWVSNREDYKYKVWMNGQGKGKVRNWHIASKIDPVEIDDFFDIFGPKDHAQMMYPGDMNGGAENVANCRCWLRYTNIAPSNLKPRGTIQVNPNVNLENENAITFSANTENKGFLTKIREKIRNRFTSNSADSNEDFSKSKRSLYKSDNKKSKIKDFSYKINNLIPLIKEELTSEAIDFGGIILRRQKFANYLSYNDLMELLNEIHPGLTANLTEVKIHNHRKTRTDKDGKIKIIAGNVDPYKPTVVNLFKTDMTKDGYYNTLIHELAHVLDSTFGGEEYSISNSKYWKEAHIKDKKHISKLEKEHGIKVKNPEFVSPYAKSKHKEHLENGECHRIFAEDFADSIRLYFRCGDEDFSQIYPNRAKIIRYVLGD